MVKKIVSVAFVILIGLPLMGTVLNWSSFASGEAKEKPGLGEEGARIPFPEVSLTSEFFVHMDAYISENFPLRDELVYMNALRDVVLLQSSFNGDVLVGKDGHLFLSETVSRAKVRALSEDELFGVSAFLNEVERRVRACGAKPLFVFVPDKRSVYEEKLPARFEDEVYMNYEVMEARLAEKGLEFVSLKELLLEAHEVGQVYSKLDTHWNRLGAYLAFSRILEELNLKNIEQDGILEYEREGDLSRMLGLGETEVTYEPQLVLGKVHYSGKVALYYDSFGLGLLPFFDEIFSNVDAYHIMDVSPLEGVSSCWGGANYVIVEIVERDITHLLNFIDGSS